MKNLQPTKAEVRASLIRNGAKNCRKFGFKHCDESNLLTDTVYAGFFESMLRDNMGVYPIVDEVANEILNEIKDVTP